MTQSALPSHDWDPARYTRFGAIRLRPAIDLIRALPPLPQGGAVDLGCGNGAVGAALKGLGRHLTGVDNSPAMLAKARDAGSHDALLETDIAGWKPETPPALIYSNAALHWVKDHQHLLPRLVGALVPGGTLAVQMPHQNNAPCMRLWVSLVDELFPGRVNHSAGPGVLLPAEYHRLLTPLGLLHLWETEYYQTLPPADDGHPVRRFTEATFARPILQSLDPAEQAELIGAYEEVIGKAYPSAPDGSVLFPFRRLFFTLTRAT